ncbi:MAG: Fic family protein [Actinobacteria bacterium]|nr:Fic family protein [Actinomycetota bacterium]
MLFSTPDLDDVTAGDLEELDGLRARLIRETHRPAPWMGTLRRLVKATTIAQSTGIEGFHVSDDEALSLVTGSARAGAGETAQQAVECYARAMNHVAVLARDPGFRWLDRVILDLHYDACSFQRDQDPGMWRTTPVAVVDGRGRIVYQAPPAGEVPELMHAVVEWLDQGDLDAHVVVRAAMAHLHVVSVHPFRDGNGRVSRIVQSLVLARDGLLTPEFASIEEYLGEHTPAYYEHLQRAHGRTYDPRRDAGGWVRFCVRAHLDQARRRLAQVQEAATRWEQLERLADDRAWPDRFVIGLEQALFGACDRASYAREADVSAATASSDLRRMVEAGLLVQSGQGPATRYTPSDTLRAAVAD